MEQMLRQWTPIARFESQSMQWAPGLWGPDSVFLGRGVARGGSDVRAPRKRRWQVGATRKSSKSTFFFRCLTPFALRKNCGKLKRVVLSPFGVFDMLGVSPWSLLLSKKHRDFEVSSLGMLVLRRTFGSIWPNFDPVFTNSDLFRPILPGRPDLFSLILTYFAVRTWPISTYFDLFRFTVRLHGRDTWDMAPFCGPFCVVCWWCESYAINNMLLAQTEASGGPQPILACSFSQSKEVADLRLTEDELS